MLLIREAQIVGLVAIAGIIVLAMGLDNPADAVDLTFLGWADQHVATDGNVDHCAAQIAALNSMAGRAWPSEIGGSIATPAFIIGGGDMTEWPSWSAKEGYNDIVKNQLNYQTYDVMGNHDFGGFSPSNTMINWFVTRYNPPDYAAKGELSYSFDYDGVHFSMLDSFFDDAKEENPWEQPITQQAIDWLKADLSDVNATTPVIIVTHLCHDAITNKNEFVSAFKDKNVVLVLGGHYETPTLQEYAGYTFVQMPGPRNEDYQAVSAFHITNDRVTAAVWDVDTGVWLTAYNLDKTIIPEPLSLCVLAVGATIMVSTVKRHHNHR